MASECFIYFWGLTFIFDFSREFGVWLEDTDCNLIYGDWSFSYSWCSILKFFEVCLFFYKSDGIWKVVEMDEGLLELWKKALYGFEIGGDSSVVFLDSSFWALINYGGCNGIGVERIIFKYGG